MDKKLRIAQVAPLWYPVPPNKYGGTERVISFLTEGLINRGHEVTLFAAPGSQTSAKLVSIFDQPLVEMGVEWSDHAWNMKNLQTVYERAQAGEFDIIHNHIETFHLFMENLVSTPTLTTIHNPLHYKKIELGKQSRAVCYNASRDTTNIVFISNAMKEKADINFKNSFVAYNSVDSKHFAFSDSPEDYFVWIARINKYKGIENAIAAAEKSRERLKIAGPIHHSQQEYFDTVVKPHLSDKIEYVGELTQEELPAFYGKAKGLLYPIEWDEPFGLVVAEAMSCGTPVVAYRRGSMPELIKDGLNGYVVDSNIDDLVTAMGKLDKLDRKVVRETIESIAGSEKMIDTYESIYRKLLS